MRAGTGSDTTNLGCYNGTIPVLPATNASFRTPSCTVDNTSRRLQHGTRYAFRARGSMMA